MTRFFLFFVFFALPSFLTAQHIPQDVDVVTDTIEIFMEGPVVKKVGIFNHIKIENWDDLANLPLLKTRIDLMVKASEEWVVVGKAEIYRFKEKEKLVEIKLLEDLKPPKGLSNWSLDSKSKVRLRWKEIAEQ